MVSLLNILWEKLIFTQLFVQMSCMHVKTDCKYFSWKKEIFVGSMNKADQRFLLKPVCSIGKLMKSGNCPENCKWFEARKGK